MPRTLHEHRTHKDKSASNTETFLSEDNIIDTV